MTQRPRLDPEQVRILPATTERFHDVATMVGPSTPGGGACWCLSQRGDGGRRDREAHMVDLVAGEDPPGLLAYVAEDSGDELAGWLGLGPRAAMPRLSRSRVIPTLDDVPVWSIVCFVVRPPFRRRGLNAIMLDAAVDLARERGVPALEAYPIDPEGERRDSTFSYVGFTTVFEDAGFERMLPTESRSAGLQRWLMRLDLR